MATIPLVYPKMPGSRDAPLGRCVAFEKYDGTNLHWVWDREFGWITFGTRRDSFYLDGRGVPEFRAAHPGLEQAADLFLATYARPLEDFFRRDERYRSPQVTVFTEFFGPGSFAGMHKKDDPKELMLFDVRIDAGLVGPEQFVRDFGGLKAARVVYRGKLTGKFADDVRQGKYGVAEGVVCKGGAGGDDVWMVKIKTNAYMEKLKQAFRERWKDYWE